MQRAERNRRTSLAVMIVAAWSVGFAVGDALATPLPTAATILTTTARSARSDAADFQWSWRLDRGQTIEIKGINGAIRAERTDGDRVEVTARKHWRNSDPEQVTIEPIEHAGGVTLCVVYPAPRGHEPNRCEPGEGGHSEVRNNDVSVDFTVRVPRGVRLAARTVNGDLELGSLDGAVVARTVNGSIELATRQSASARTVNGSIRASVGERRWRDALEFSTVNGQVTVEIPADVSADVHAKTVNGSISSDFPLTVRGRFRRQMSGTLGEGGGSLDLSTVNGSIHLLEAR